MGSNCNLHNQTAKVPQLTYTVGLWRLQSPTRRWMTNCICKLRNFCSLIVQIAVGLRRLQLDCGDCSWIVEIAVGLWRLQLDCRDCSWIAEIAVGLWILQSPRCRRIDQLYMLRNFCR